MITSCSKLVIHGSVRAVNGTTAKRVYVLRVEKGQVNCMFSYVESRHKWVRRIRFGVDLCDPTILIWISKYFPESAYASSHTLVVREVGITHVLILKWYVIWGKPDPSLNEMRPKSFLIHKRDVIFSSGLTGVVLRHINCFRCCKMINHFKNSPAAWVAGARNSGFGLIRSSNMGIIPLYSLLLPPDWI